MRPPGFAAILLMISAMLTGTRMNLRRARWIRESMGRDNRIVDTQIMNGS